MISQEQLVMESEIDYGEIWYRNWTWIPAEGSISWRMMGRIGVLLTPRIDLYWLECGDHGTIFRSNIADNEGAAGRGLGGSSGLEQDIIL